MLVYWNLEPSFHIRSMEEFMFMARPTGLQPMPPPNANHSWLKPNIVECQDAEWGVKGHDQRYYQFLLYTALFHEDYLRKTVWIAHDGIGGILQTRLLKRNTLNRSCDYMQAATISLRLQVKDQQATGLSNDPNNVDREGLLLN